MKYRWSLAPSQPLLASQLAAPLGISPLLAQCLLKRGLSEPDVIARFLQPRLKNLADPFLLPNMEQAVTRLLQARERGEALVIFGDYDVDGVTSTTLLLEVFGRLGWQTNAYLPHRMDEGYGLSQDGVENCLKKFPTTLLLAVDCGSTAVSTIGWLKERGVDVIVLDHHQVSEPAPAAVALVNPQLQRVAGVAAAEPGTDEIQNDRQDGRSIFTELCSAGLAFKLAHALVKRGRATGLPGAAEFDLKPLLDLVALGTVADIVPLVGENRILVSAGLDRLNSTQRPGLVALKQVAQTPAKLGTYELGFQLGPRLNAAGRLETAEESLRLLRARDRAEALPIAQRLDSQNRERQKIERGIVDEVIGAVRARFRPEADFVIVEGHCSGTSAWWASWRRVFSRSFTAQQSSLVATVTCGAGPAGASRVSILPLHCASGDDLLVRHGGHAMAAGLTIQPDNSTCSASA